MRRLLRTGAATAAWSRGIMLRVHETRDPERFPLGYAPITSDTRPGEALHLVREGHYIMCERSMGLADDTFRAVSHLLELEHPAETYADLVAQHDAKVNLAQRLLVKREFWDHDDFLDMQHFTSAGPENAFFDNYKWTTELWKEFRTYVERYAPTAEHSHITYGDYRQLMRYFAGTKLGMNTHGALPKKVKLQPTYGLELPTQTSMIAFQMYRAWLDSFVRSYGIKRALVVRAGAGIAALQTRLAVKHVTATDPRVTALETIRAESKREKHLFGRIDAKMADMFPANDDRKFDLVTFAPHVPFIDTESGEMVNKYAPTMTGVRGALEQFFEGVSERLAPRGIAVVLFNNGLSMAEPLQPHPVEHELRANRRFVLLDYYSKPPKRISSLHVEDAAHNAAVRMHRALQARYRGEVWVLHKLEDLHAFGWVHGIPGSEPPPDVAAAWHGVSLQAKRIAMMKQRVSEMGGLWGDYKDRLLDMLRADAGEDDEVSAAVRARLDPLYAETKAQEAKHVVLRNIEARRTFNADVAASFVNRSPRDAFDAEAADVRAALSLGGAAAPEKKPPPSPKRRKRVPKKAAVERSL